MCILIFIIAYGINNSLLQLECCSYIINVSLFLPTNIQMAVFDCQVVTLTSISYIIRLLMSYNIILSLVL